MQFEVIGEERENANMTVTLALADGRKVLLPLSPKFYRAREVVSNQSSLCTVHPQRDQRKCELFAFMANLNRMQHHVWTRKD